MYSFHITFADGSNPYYHFPCNYKKHITSIKRWKRFYNMTVIGRSENMIFFYAVSNINTPQVRRFM